MGLTFDKMIVILLIAVIVLGPQRLPYYAKKLGDLVRALKNLANDAKDRLKEEMGDDFDDVDWKQLDPRQYDPRRIIREALEDDDRERRPTSTASAAAGAVAAAGGAVGASGAGNGAAPAPVGTGTMHFDDEAT